MFYNKSLNNKIKHSNKKLKIRSLNRNYKIRYLNKKLEVKSLEVDVRNK